MTEKINPSLIKMANAMLKGHLGEAAELAKEGFVPAAAVKASQGMPPGAPMPPAAPMPPQAPMPPGAPMPPAGPTPAAGPMPPGGAPMDPSMMGGAPPMDPSMGGMPPGGGQMVAVSLEDLMMLFQQISEQQGAMRAEEDALAGPNEGDEPPTTNKQIGARIDALDEKVDMLLSAITGGMAPGAEGGAPMGGEEIPPELMAAMGGAMPPDVAAEGAPAAMGAPMPAEAAVGAPAPMLPSGMGGMPVSASGNGGMKKSAAMSVSKLAARLKR